MSENVALPESGTPSSPSFASLGLSPQVLKALQAVGYETPSPIQAAAIPALLAGRHMLGQAQTGTGKTAAFALPILSNIDLNRKGVQALVLAPTRELAIQVAEAFQKYATGMPGFSVLPIYGGQSYGPQLTALKRGVHVVVGTPGRVIDHLERGSLKLDTLTCAVLDEADEMLRMGFIDAVEQILKTTPASKQVALFSATMPPQIKRIAQTYLKDPIEVSIAAKTRTATNVHQRYWLVSGTNKLDALTRMLEVENFEGMLIFTRTKIATEELAEKLSARGYSVAALNGDIQQAQRERVVAKLKDGQLDIVVATDVAARGLDVERVSHVVNYDVPTDTESYVHRIGRTGRAGRSGEAILFIQPRERNLLRMIERATRQPIEAMNLPTVEDVNAKRMGKFKQKIVEALQSPKDIAAFRDLVAQVEHENEIPMLDIAAALARLAQGETPLLLAADSHSDRPAPRSYEREAPTRERTSNPRPVRSSDNERPRKPFESKPERVERLEFKSRERPVTSGDEEAAAPRPPRKPKSDVGMETFRVEVGHNHSVKPGNIVGAIANEAGVESQFIGRIDIRDDHSLIDLPEGMPDDVFRQLQTIWVAGQQLRISRAGEERAADLKPHFKAGPKPGFKPKKFQRRDA